MPGILDPYLKLGRAKVHLEALDIELETFRKANPYTMERYDDLENKRHVLSVKLNDVPDPVSLIVGDALYCMRSALDQLVWSLAKLTVKIPAISTQFPIFGHLPETAKDVKRWSDQVSGVPDKAIAEIKSFQPYHRGTSFKAHALWRLNALCNVDKHRRIPANGSEVVIHFPKVAQKWTTVEALNDRHIVSVPIAHKDKLQLHPSITFKVNFGWGDVTISPDDYLTESREGLWEIHNFLGNTVLPRFARFFV